MSSSKVVAVKPDLPYQLVKLCSRGSACDTEVRPDLEEGRRTQATFRSSEMSLGAALNLVQCWMFLARYITCRGVCTGLKLRQMSSRARFDRWNM